MRLKNNDMRLKLVQIPIVGSERFEKTTSGVYISNINYEILTKKLKLPSNDVLYAKLECKELLSKFVIYAQIDRLAKDAEGDDENIYLHKDFLGKNFLDNGKLSVEITSFKIEQLPYAEKVVIQLPEKEVELWSEEEIEHALSVLSHKNKFVELGKQVNLSPRTKSNVKGIVENILPEGEFLFENLYRVDSSTEFILKGLPEKRQKVLEFEKIGGLNETLIRLREIIQLPLNYPSLFEKFDMKPYRGLLLYGPPGNGKTLIAKELAKSLGGKFFQIEGAELMSKYVSVGEKELRKVFEDAEMTGNAVIFIDELDAIAIDRSDTSEGYEVRYVTTLLTLMDGMKDKKSNILVIGATNRLGAIDKALRRPGRFDLEFEIPLPDAQKRYEIFKLYCKLSNECIEEDITEEYLKELCKKAEGFSGADMAGVYREASMNAIRDNLIVEPNGKTAIKKVVSEIKIKREHLESAFNKFSSYSNRQR